MDLSDSLQNEQQSLQRPLFLIEASKESQTGLEAVMGATFYLSSEPQRY